MKSYVSQSGETVEAVQYAAPDGKNPGNLAELEHLAKLRVDDGVVTVEHDDANEYLLEPDGWLVVREDASVQIFTADQFADLFTSV